jgi:hypothetical protein
MRKIFGFALLLFSANGISSCCREGTDGDATIVVFPKHHTNAINNHVGYPDTVFVKFNAHDLPGTTPADFDTYFVGEGREDHIHCEHLKCGDYYFYVTGYDSSSSINTRVVGGTHVKIKHKDRKEETELEVGVSEI